MKKSRQPTRRDRELEALQEKFFPDPQHRRWPPKQGRSGWFKGPRVLPLIIQILTAKSVSSRGQPGLTYVELLSRVRDVGFLELDDPRDHARMVGYARHRTWEEAFQRLVDLGFVEVKSSHMRKFAYAIIVNPYIPVRRLYQQNKVSEDLWHLFHASWVKTGAEIPDDELPPAAAISSKERTTRVHKGPRAKAVT
jgi:hypothetical protein